MTFAQFRQHFDILAPHLSKKHGRYYIVTDDKRVSQFPTGAELPVFAMLVCDEEAICEKTCFTSDSLGDAYSSISM